MKRYHFRGRPDSAEGCQYTECTVRDFVALAFVRNDEAQTRVEDPNHFAYSSVARSARARRDKLYTSTEGLKAQLEAARIERDAALERLSRIEDRSGH